MSDEKATRENLIRCAREEFLEKGYMKASLRSICKKAGVTTGALYFFFENKEDLLTAVVAETLDGLMELVQSHFSRELGTEAQTALAGDASEDIESAKAVLRYLYQHYDTILILLTKSQGSAYENILEQFVSILEGHYDMLTGRLAEKFGIRKPEQAILHWASHMQTDTFVYLLTHERDEQKALKDIEQIVTYLVAGWIGAFVTKT